MNPNIILFTDTNDYDVSIRPGGIYKVASELRHLGYNVLVNPFCSNLSLQGWKDLAKKYISKDLIWIGLSTTFLTYNPVTHNFWLDKFYHEKRNQIDFFDFDNTQVSEKRPRIAEKLLYDGTILKEIQQLFAVPLVIGGSQLTRNKKMFDSLESNKNIITVPGYAEGILKNLTEQIQTTKTYVDTRKQFYSFDREKYRRTQMVFTKDDYIDKKEWLPLEVNRGCAFKCAYCTYDHIGLKDHYKLSSTLLEEIQRNKDQFGTAGYFVLDDLYNDSQEKVMDLYENVFSKTDVEFNSYIRLDLLWRFPEQIDVLRKSGLRACNFGIETLNDKAGKLVGKGLGEKRIVQTLNNVYDQWEDSVVRHGLWIAGLPYEDEKSWQRTLDMTAEWKLTHGNNWNALYINYTYDSLHKSLLDSNYKDYGYNITKTGWIHEDGYTEQDAKRFVKKAIDRLKDKNLDHYKYGNFRSAGLSHNDIVQNGMTFARKKSKLNSLNLRRTFNRNFLS